MMRVVNGRLKYLILDVNLGSERQVKALKYFDWMKEVKMEAARKEKLYQQDTLLD